MKLHQRILANSAVKKKYPRGVDGMAGDLLSVAAAAPHLGDGHIPMVLNALLTKDPHRGYQIIELRTWRAITECPRRNDEAKRSEDACL